MSDFMNSQSDPYLRAEKERKTLRDDYFTRGKIVAICEALLAEEIGVIAASRRLRWLGESLCESHDEDFLIFVGIDSETDHLPVDKERHNWSVEALQRKDKEIEIAEASYQKPASERCRKLIEKFRLKD